MTASRGFAIVGLHMPKTDSNIGSALRACGCYGASGLIVSGRRYKKHGTDTMHAYRHMPMFQCEDIFDFVPYDCVPVAVDLVDDAEPIQQYKHPERACYIFGPEDGTLGAKILSRCRDRVFVPTNHCMNLAATVNVILYDRLAKQLNSKKS
jgi:tRNA(Leu) C34 or U34 (ribose-2'-O)-methylase TrmL